MILTDKTIVITGASDGLGRQIALKLAEEKTNIALIARNKERLMKVKSEAVRLGAKKAETYICDLRNKPDIAKTVDKIVKDFGNVDILINDASIWQKRGQLDTLGLPDIEDVISTNLMGLILITRLLLPELRKSKEGAIINISSRSGYMAQEGQSVYSASKWGVTGFTEVLKTDLKGSNVKVATIHQGKVNTKIFEKAGETVDTANATNPADLADVIVFMLTRPPKIWLHDVRVEY